MLMISKEAMESILAIRQKLDDPEKRAECIADIENMIEIKQSHLWRAEWGSCCGSICNLVSQIDNEMGILQEVLNAMEAGDDSKAASLLEDYIAFLEKHYEREHPNYW